MIRLTFDLEIYPPMRDDDAFTNLQGQIVQSIADRLRNEDVCVTCFCTGEFSLRFPDLVRKLHANGNEIANHSMYHIPFRDSDEKNFVRSILDCDEAIKAVVGIKPIGFRAPGGNVPPGIAASLQSIGFLYDSSMCRTYIPGWYEGGLCPATPYHPSVADIRREDPANSSFVEVPLGRFPHLPVPLGGMFLTSFPILSSRIIEAMCEDSRIHVMYLHPVDFLSPQESRRYPWDHMRMRDRARSVLSVVLSSSGLADMRLSTLARGFVDSGL
jgi:peptidoglycan/xylan/chitin deacetylase (PgdA/CDA1 family)